MLRICTWDQYDFANITVEFILFGGPVQVRFLPGFNSGRVITERMVVVLNDFLALSPVKLPTIKQLLWADCLDDFENISYGFGPDTGEPELVVNQREFGVYSAEDAYAQSNLICLSIPEEPTLRHRYGAIEFEPTWAGYRCSIIRKTTSSSAPIPMLLLQIRTKPTKKPPPCETGVIKHIVRQGESG